MANDESTNKGKETFDPAESHRRLIRPDRYKPEGSSVPGRSMDDEAASDRARVIYCSAFRRLQHKTQVFTLAKDAAVRSRLTHSLEVASVGRWIAQQVVDVCLHPAGLQTTDCSALVALVETACLAHDIGNPPFGHFGESVIKNWFRHNWIHVAGYRSGDKRLQQLMEDFLHFDGNPQGIRILTRLQGRTRQERRLYGMDLTYSQILTALKYPRGPLDQASKWKKAGFFESERPKIEPAWKLFGMHVQQRFPLSYLVEAADDISYCISDMEDGIDHSIFTPRQFFDQISRWVQKATPSRFPLTDLRKEAMSRDGEVMKTSDPDEARDHFVAFKTRFTATMISEAARLYGGGDAEDIRGGTRVDLFEDTDAYDLLESLKEIARRFLYTADIVQRPFLAGLKVVTGILDEYSRLLRLTGEQFALLRGAWRSADRGDVIAQDLETLLPLLDGLPPTLMCTTQRHLRRHRSRNGVRRTGSGFAEHTSSLTICPE